MTFVKQENIDEIAVHTKISYSNVRAAYWAQVVSCFLYVNSFL